jgi:hypothetical protein
MATKLFTVGNNGNRSTQAGLGCLCAMSTELFTLDKHVNYGNQGLGQKRLKCVPGFTYKWSVDIFWPIW